MKKAPTIAFVDIDAMPLVPGGRDEGSRHAAALERLAAERIVLVLCSGRTRAEMEALRQAFGIFHPFVAERGGAAFVPERYFAAGLGAARPVGGYQALEFGLPYSRIVEIVHRVADRQGVGIVGFSDMSVEGVARECGLPLLDARLATLRECSEMFRLHCANPVAERRLLAALDAAGVTCTRQGDFFFAGGTRGPAPARAALVALYRDRFGAIVTAGVAAALAPSGGPDARTAGRWLEWTIERIEVTGDDVVERAETAPDAAPLLRGPSGDRGLEPGAVGP